MKHLICTTLFLAVISCVCGQTWAELDSIGQKLYGEEKFEEGTGVFERALIQAKKESGTDHLNYASACNNLAFVYRDQGLFAKGEPLYLEAKRIREKILGKENAVYATTCHSLAILYHQSGQLNPAEKLYQEAKAIRERVVGKDHEDYASSCNDLAAFYREKGDYDVAEKLFVEAKDIRMKNPGRESYDYAVTCGDLGDFYADQNQISKAEELFQESNEIMGRIRGKEGPDYAIGCNALANLYQRQALYSKAEPLYLVTKDILEKTFGKDHPYYAGACNNLAGIYDNQGQYAKAEVLYLEGKEIREKTLGKDHPDYANSCNNLAFLYEAQDLFEKAEPLHIEALEIRKKVYGTDHPDFGQSCNNLGIHYRKRGLYNKAEPLFIQAHRIYKTKFGSENGQYATVSQNFGDLYNAQGKYDSAESYYRKASLAFLRQTETNFDHLSEREKGLFFGKFKNCFEVYNSLAIKSGKPELSAWLFDNVLITKALLFNSSLQTRNRILASQDVGLIKDYQQWIRQREQIAKGSQLSLAARKRRNINLDSLEDLANRMERQLSQKASAVGGIELRTRRFTWQEIQKQLQNDEAVVEIVRSRFFDKKMTDSVVYVALILTPETTTYPRMIVLPNGRQMEDRYINYYHNQQRLKNPDYLSYPAFWQPIKEQVGAAKKLYFSPDGVYHQLNLQTLLNPQTRTHLDAEIDVRLLTSSRDLMRHRLPHAEKNFKDYQIHLSGYPNFPGKKGESRPKTEIDSTRALPFTRSLLQSQRFIDWAGGQVSPLPGTKKEVESIAQFAIKAGMKTSLYLNDDATEENLKGIRQPHILHIATHGFFIMDATVPSDKRSGSFENPLLRSGLLLTGAEASLRNQIAVGSENGILTAQEAMNLDLFGTDLVVMSACETGLGEIRNGEGVYGLQRAFQQAGAKTLLMSLWKVDDATTQKMMTLFYRNLLQKRKSKRQAFTDAVNEIKKQDGDPYHWGAFVMIGEQ